MDSRFIRNFCIIAHIDHGKSTLADRLLEQTHTLAARQMKDQVLDNMDLERERGITIKAHAVRMRYTALDGQEYILNLIDTPGHVDFSYEVSRSLAACEGALLLVDASQGIEAQTISNLFLALDNNLAIIPVINKIDLPNIHVESVIAQIVELMGVEKDEILLASAKEGIGVVEILEAIVQRIPSPSGDRNAPLKALIFDSTFDQYRGAISFARVFDGVLLPQMNIRFFSHPRVYKAEEIGILRLERIPVQELSAGEVGYIVANIKNVADTKVGDTITDNNRPAFEPLPGYKDVKPMVFSGLYPVDPDNYEELRDAIERLSLSDAALVYEPETSSALGFGFRCGFLGLLHMEIVQERLEREYTVDIITTVPNVRYQVVLTDGQVVWIENPSKFPPANKIERAEEPYLSAQIITPVEYLGNIMKLASERRGIYINTEYASSTRAVLHYELPLSEVVFDFYDKLKSLSRGYASFDYEYKEHRTSELIKLDVLINGDSVDALSIIIHRDKAYNWGRELCTKLRSLIPRQLFEVVIQAAIGSKVISREVVHPLRKNVTAKCYGGDITRKRKLLERQREGKKRMKQIGSVEIPQEAFLAVLNIGG